jgi:hypothetical protein
MNPAGILKNTKTGRYHPILFRRAPMPGNSDADLALQRYKSAGHHTAGFATLEEAQSDLARPQYAEQGYKDSGAIWEWDGENVPAMVEWFGRGGDRNK